MIDFGLAKATAEAADEMDLTHGGFVGTPAFASPEQFGGARGRRAVGHLFVRRDALVRVHRRSSVSRQDNRGNPQSADGASAAARATARPSIPAPVIGLLRSTLAVDPAQRPASRASCS